jgi:hypothetical protein
LISETTLLGEGAELVQPDMEFFSFIRWMGGTTLHFLDWGSKSSNDNFQFRSEMENGETPFPREALEAILLQEGNRYLFCSVS